jgi:hypothetical protein
MAALVGHATEQLLDHDAAPALRRDARALDSAHQTLIATARPLRQNLFGELDERVSQSLGLAAASRDYGRNLVTDVGAADLDLDPDSRQMLERASRTLNTSIEQLIRAVDEAVGGVYIRSAGLFDRVERTLEARGGAIDDRLALRDFQLIDQALACLAAAMNLPVTSYDTAGIDAPQIAQ